MSEDSPLDPTQALPPQEDQPDQYPQDQAGHIEAAHHDEGQQQAAEVEQAAPGIGETPKVNTEDSEPKHLGAINHDDDLAQLTPEEEQRSPNRILSKDKAWGMAYAGKHERDRAVLYRDTAKELKDLLTEAEALAMTPTPENSTESEKLGHREYDFRRRLNTIVNLKTRNEYGESSGYLPLDGLDSDILRVADKRTWSNDREHTKESFERRLPQLESIADSWDNRAAQRERWEGILHDHPVSQAYKEAHPDVRFDRRSLSRIEEDYDEQIAVINGIEERLEQAGQQLGIEGLGDLAEIIGYGYNPAGGMKSFKPADVISKAWGHEGGDETSEEQTSDREKREEWEALLNSPNATLGQLRDFYVDALRVGVIGPARSSAAALNVILEDIKSGRASQ